MDHVYEVSVIHCEKTYKFAIPSPRWTGSIADLIAHEDAHPLWQNSLERLNASRSFHAGMAVILLSEPAKAAMLGSSYGASKYTINQITKEQFDMNAPVIQEITQYRGRNIKDLSIDTILEAIRSDKKEITSLEAVGVESSHIAARIATLNAGIARLVAEMDARG